MLHSRLALNSDSGQHAGTPDKAARAAASLAKLRSQAPLLRRSLARSRVSPLRPGPRPPASACTISAEYIYEECVPLNWTTLPPCTAACIANSRLSGTSAGPSPANLLDLDLGAYTHRILCTITFCNSLRSLIHTLTLAICNFPVSASTALRIANP